MIRNLIAGALILLILLAPYSVFAAANNPACTVINTATYSPCCLQSNGGDATQCVTFAATLKATQAALNTGAAQPVLQTATAINNINTAATTGVNAQYTPQVSVDFASNGSFGGLSFKGVGATLLQCSGAGDYFAGLIGTATSKIMSAVGKVASKVGGVVLNIAEKIPYVGGLIGSIFKGTSKPAGSDPQHPTYTQSVPNDPLVKKAECLDGIAYVLSQQVLQQITNRTLHWANTGFLGNPLYVKNIDSFLLSMRNQQTAVFLATAQNSDPIFGNALRSIITLQVAGVTDGYLNKSLNTPQAAAYNSFMGDFTNGGWDALLNPSYNPIGALFNASDNLTQSIATQQANTQTELQQGNGFLGMKNCAQTVADVNKGQVKNSGINGSGLISSNIPDSTCLKWETVTPGSIVQQQVATITNSPVRQAELATQFNQAVGAFFDSMLTQLFTRGLSGIKGVANPSDLNGLVTGGLGTNTVTGINGNTLPGVNDGQASINDIFNATNTVDISHPQLLRAILQTQYNFVNRSTDSDIALDRLVPELGKLDYCLPGPNPTWQDSLTDNVTTYTTNATDNGSTITNTGLSLYDKFTTNSVPIGDRTLAVSNTKNIKVYLQTVSTSLQQDITAKFGRDAIGNAFAATETTAADQAVARGMATNIYDEVSALPAFASGAVQLDQQYSTSISATQSNIQQLEAISAQVNTIVAAAKARYETEQKKAGTPVNQQCLDTAYKVDTSAVTGVTRQEPNVSNPIIQQFIDADSFFYKSL